jgi:hypothetical protein
LPEYAKDIAITIVGAAIALAGLLLVFSGFVFAQADTFPPTTDDKTIKRYKSAGKWGLLPFGLALTDAAIAMGWLLNPCPGLYVAALAGFFMSIGLAAAYGGFCLLIYL